MKYAYNTASPDRYKLLKEKAHKNKQFPTEAEAYLWNFLSGKQLGVKFNRQHIIGDYIVDFVCLEKQLVIEVDGDYHNEERQIEEDENRTIILNRMGFEVLRFSNDDVLNHTDEVIDRIYDELE